MSGKKYYNVTIHCVRCTSLPWSLCVRRLIFFFWVDFDSNMAVELSFGSSTRVLKLDGCTNKSVSASYLCLLILSWHMARCTVVPPWKLWFIQGGTILTKYRKASCWRKMIDSFESGTLQNPPESSRLRTWNDAIQSWEPSPWKRHGKKGEFGSSEKKKDNFKKMPYFLFHLDSWGKVGI